MTLLDYKVIDSTIALCARTSEDACIFPVLRAENNQVYLYIEPDSFKDTKDGNEEGIKKYLKNVEDIKAKFNLQNEKRIWNNYNNSFIIGFQLGDTGDVNLDTDCDDFLYYADAEGFKITQKDISESGEDNLFRQCRNFLLKNPDWCMYADGENLVFRKR